MVIVKQQLEKGIWNVHKEYAFKIFISMEVEWNVGSLYGMDGKEEGENYAEERWIIGGKLRLYLHSRWLRTDYKGERKVMPWIISDLSFYSIEVNISDVFQRNITIE